MLVRTHDAFIRLALAATSASAQGAASWDDEDAAAILAGHRDEDDYVVFGVRLRAPGLTHTYRPGRRRGELLASNAKDKMLRCLDRARREHERDRARAAWWLGRACHLMGDMAVPARTRGVGHLLGDPLEAWLEARADRLDDLAAPREIPFDPATAAEELARASMAHPAGVALSDAAARAQAEDLVPRAIAATASLLRAARRSC